MQLPWRDVLATVCVALAVVVVGAWAVGATLPGFDNVGAVAIAVLVLGVAASMSAVVPGWNDLIHGSRLYFAGASAIGVVALVAALWAIIAGDATALAPLILATVVLWAISTMRHLGIHLPQQRLGHR